MIDLTQIDLVVAAVSAVAGYVSGFFYWKKVIRDLEGKLDNLAENIREQEQQKLIQSIESLDQARRDFFNQFPNKRVERSKQYGKKES